MEPRLRWALRYNTQYKKKTYTWKVALFEQDRIPGHRGMYHVIAKRDGKDPFFPWELRSWGDYRSAIVTAVDQMLRADQADDYDDGFLRDPDPEVVARHTDEIIELAGVDA